jgi:transposase-like protein
MDNLFRGRYFHREIIILYVCWYLRFKLSFSDLVEMMAERGIEPAHRTIMRRIQRCVPHFVKRWNRFACKAGRSRRVDETYEKIKGLWTYLYRAVDSDAKTVDFLLRAKRDVAAAKAFFSPSVQKPGQIAASHHTRRLSSVASRGQGVSRRTLAWQANKESKVFDLKSMEGLHAE